MAVAENPKFPSEHSCPGGMMVSEPIDDIVAWSNTLSTWRQDCLRRLALADDLSESDQAELLGMIKQEAGLALAEAPPTAIPFTKQPFNGRSHTPIVLKVIANIVGVNPLLSNASLDFLDLQSKRLNSSH